MKYYVIDWKFPGMRIFSSWGGVCAFFDELELKPGAWGDRFTVIKGNDMGSKKS